VKNQEVNPFRTILGSGKRIGIIIGIWILTAAVHIFRVGSYLDGEWFHLYYSYFSDILLPFTFYFMICVSEVQLPFLHHWSVKATIVFVVPAIAETCQLFGIPVLGSTFDPWDYLAYAIGALLAAAVDVWVFSRVFPFWIKHKVADVLMSFFVFLAFL